MSDYSFEPGLPRASTIPAGWYFDPAVLERENRTVFARTWQLAGLEQGVREPGSYFTASIGGEPVIVVRDRSGELLALSNVCRHRAGPVAAGEGKRPVFQCGYHGWTYSLDGQLLTTPEFDGVECFRKEEVALPRFAVGVWKGLVFVRIDRDGPPLDEYLDELSALVRGHELESYAFAVRKDWTIECNWKVYVDNYLEGYHIPIVHPSLFRELDYERYRTETLRHVSIQHSPIREAKRLRRGEGREGSEAKYFWLFPNLMLNVYPDNFSTNLILPLGPERTLTVFEWFFRNPVDAEVREKIARTVEFSDEIQLEDIAICEAVQRGLHSSTYTAGRYSVKRENGVHHFHGLLAEFLGSAGHE